MLGAEGDEDDAEQDEAIFWVLPENWDCVEVFCSLGSRWQVDGMTGKFYGFARGDIVSTFELMQIKPDRYLQIFEDLQVMERETLKVLNRE